MTTPTITDWIQAGSSAAALLLAVSSLVWQWRTRAAAKRDQLRVEAERDGPGYWHLIVSYDPADRANQLTLRIRVAGNSRASVYDYDAFPEIRDAYGSTSKNFAAGYDLNPQSTVDIEMSHSSPPSTDAVAWLMVRGAEEDRPLTVVLEVRSADRRRPVAKSTRLITPIA